MKKLMLLLPVLLVASCGKTQAPESPLDAAARRTCMDTIESRAISRKSISYQSEGERSPVTKSGNGNLEVSIKFSAKNEIGLASSLMAKCIVSPDGNSLVDISVKDSR